jgi:tetratricopeptide (TPR) repeat protein
MNIKNARRIMHAATLTILFLICVSASAVFAQNTEMPLTGSKEAVALYLQGRDKIENLEDAGALFEQAIEKDPSFAIAYLSAGRTNQEFRKNVAKAVSFAEKVSPGERELIMATKEQNDGNPAGRKAHLDNLLKLHPGDKRVQSQMGFYYRSIGDDASALKYFNQAAKLDKKYAPVYNNIGYSNIALGKFDDAEAAFKTYIKLIPKNPNPYDSYAELLMKTGKYDESIAQYNKALATDPTFFNSYRGIGNNYVYKGDFARARESYKMMYDKSPDGGGRDLALVSMMNSYIAEGNIDKALEVNDQRRAAAEKEGDVGTVIGIRFASGFVLLEAGRLQEAGEQFAMADKLRDDPSLPATLAENRRFGKMQANARLLIAQGEFSPARTQIEEMGQFVAKRNNPNQTRTYNAIAGILELKQKNYVRAIEYFAKADPNDPYTWFYQAAAYDGAGDMKTAGAIYGRVANWNQLDDTGHAIVRPRAVSRNSELAKLPK